MTYKYTQNNIRSLEECISTERLSTYISEASSTHEAIELYKRNAELSAAFYLPLQTLEVSVRNAVHREMSVIVGRSDWYNVFNLDPTGQRLVSKAKSQVSRFRQQVNPPHVVAELSFGFWLALIGRQYHQTLWIPGLNKAFPNAHLSRADISRELDHLRLLRNRIAHHEPIFKRDLVRDHESIVDSLKWICPDVADWTKTYSKVLDTLAT